MPGTKKKICYLIDTLYPHSGWGRLASEIINRLEKTSDYEVVILVHAPSGDRREHVILESGLWGMVRSIIRSRVVMRNCDIIHSFDGWPNSVIAYIGSLFLKKPLYITAVGTYSVLPLDFWVQGLLLRKAYRRAKKIFAISNYTKHQIVKRMPLNNIETVNLGVDFEKFHRSYRDPATKENIILSVGEIKPRKGYRVSIDAIVRLRKKIPDITYMIAGGGNNLQSRYFCELQKLVAEYGAQKNVFFLGDVSGDELLELYTKAKILVLPSLEVGGAFEGFGLVLLEANSAGIPVIGTTPSGMDDIINEGFNGFLVERGNAAGLEKVLARLFENPSLLKDMSNNSIATARTFSWDRTVEIYRARYEEFFKKL